jgi:hypothetical protein
MDLKYSRQSTEICSVKLHLEMWLTAYRTLFFYAKFLGLQLGNRLNWKNRIVQLVPKLSRACFAIRSRVLQS